MRRRNRWFPIITVLLAACQATSEPPLRSFDPTAVATTHTVDELAALRASDQFDEFAEHERAVKADGARLAWQNFAPIVDGRRVEWSNKAELWDSIAPKIRDEALLLGPEYRKPLWNNRNAIPNSIAMAWNNEDTEGRGHYLEFLATYESTRGPAERIWGFLISFEVGAVGRVVAARPAADYFEGDFAGIAEQDDAATEAAWLWVQAQGGTP